MWQLDYKESWVLRNWCFWTVVLEKTLECPLDCKESQPVHPKGDQSWVHWKDWCWSWNSNTLATWCKELTHLKRPWCLERLWAGEGGDRGWGGWMASLTQRTWVWVNSRSWWWTVRPVMLVGTWGCKESDTTERLNWTDSYSPYMWNSFWFICLLQFLSSVSHSFHHAVISPPWLYLLLIFLVFLMLLWMELFY